MARKLLPNTLWGNVQYLQPSNPPSSRKGGRPLADDRLALRGILFVLRTGLPWEDVLAEVFGLSGMTCDGDASGTEWRRKSELRSSSDSSRTWGCGSTSTDRSRAAIGFMSIAAVDSLGPNTRTGARQATSSAWDVQARPANRRVSYIRQQHDRRGALPQVNDIAPVKGPRSSLRRPPDKLHAD